MIMFVLATHRSDMVCSSADWGSLAVGDCWTVVWAGCLIPWWMKLHLIFIRKAPLGNWYNAHSTRVWAIKVLKKHLSVSYWVRKSHCKRTLFRSKVPPPKANNEEAHLAIYHRRINRNRIQREVGPNVAYAEVAPFNGTKFAYSEISVLS